MWRNKIKKTKYHSNNFTMINYFPRVFTMYNQSSSLNKQINQL